MRLRLLIASFCAVTSGLIVATVADPMSFWTWFAVVGLEVVGGMSLYLGAHTR